jgi:serine/threonine protein kinase
LEAFEGEVGGKCIMFEYCPNGDFFDFVTSQPKLPEKIVRTYFHQLIQVIEYLHSSKIAHMDIKLENFLLDERFQLKLTDFDLALEFGEKPILKGTINYRAPEIISGECSDLSKVDIYSAGICLFLMLTGGSMPHIEDQNLDDGTNLFNLFARNKEEFWKKQCQLINVNHSFFSPSFRELFNMMTEVDPKKRATLDQIKSSEWYNDKILSHNELTFYFEN